MRRSNSYRFRFLVCLFPPSRRSSRVCRVSTKIRETSAEFRLVRSILCVYIDTQDPNRALGVAQGNEERGDAMTGT